MRSDGERPAARAFGMGWFPSRFALGAVHETLANFLLATASAHQNVWHLFERPGAGDRLSRWKPGMRLPVVFCHGYCGDRSNFMLLRRSLHAAGFRSQAAVWLWPFWRSCADYARLIEGRVEEVIRKTGAPRVDLVAHSMGGLAARRYLLGRGAERVRRLVTIGTPHRGTIAAALGAGACARDLQPESEFLRALDGDLESHPPGTVLSIYGDVDGFAGTGNAPVPAPQENLRVPGLGHSGLLCSRRVAGAIAAALPAPETARARPLPAAPVRETARVPVLA